MNKNLPVFQRASAILSNPNFLALGVIAIIALSVIGANGARYANLHMLQQTRVFADVEPGDVFYPSIESAYKLGLFTGVACGGPGEPCDAAKRPYFRWGQPYTRNDLLLALTKLKSTTTTTKPQVYADVPPSSPNYNGASLLADSEMLESYPCGSPGEPCDDQNRPYLRVRNPLTRAEIANVVFIINSKSQIVVIGATQESFEDVTTTNTYWKAIEYAHYSGWINGWGCGSIAGLACVAPENRPYFLPNALLTRGQASRIIVSALQ